MTPNEFQAEMVSIHQRHSRALTDLAECEWTALALAGEVGELANEVKKIRRDDRGELTADRSFRCVSELADVLAYAAVLARHLDVSFSGVLNLAATQARVWDKSRCAQ